MLEADLTVIVPVYNGMPFLPQTIDSLLMQSYDRFVIHVINDGSTDHSKEYLDSIVDPRMRVFHQKNIGLCATLNKAISQISTPFIARLDQDDCCKPDRLRLQIEFLKSYDSYGAVLGNINRISGGRSFGTHMIINGEFEEYSSCKHGCVVHSTMMVRTDCLHKLGGYRPEYYPVDDFDLLMRMEECTKISLLSHVVVDYRIHNSAGTFSTTTSMDWKTRWALENARRRRKNLAELDDIVFRENERERYWVMRAIEKNSMYGRLMFRQAGLYIGNRKFLTGILYLLLAFLLAPRFSLSRALSMIRSGCRIMFL